MPRLISLFDVQPLWLPLSQGQLILTPNQRLARRIQSAYAIACAERGQIVVKSPRVYSLNHWIDACWRQLLISAAPIATEKLLLSSTQQHALWEQIVSDSHLGAALLRPAATAQQAARAYSALVNWRQPFAMTVGGDVDGEMNGAGDTASGTAASTTVLRQQLLADEDSAVLLGWIDQFEQRCQQQGWLPAPRLAERVLAAFEQQLLSSEGHIIGVGFEQIPPLQQALLNAAGRFESVASHRHGAAGDSLAEPKATLSTPTAAPNKLSLACGQTNVTVVECQSPLEEIQAAALWAKQQLALDPKATVAIVVPELTAARQRVERILLEVFDPDFNRPLTAKDAAKDTSHGEAQDANDDGRRNLPFNFSAGYPLSEAPIISAALDVLTLASPRLAVDKLQAICQSPYYLLDESDAAPLSELVRKLYEQGSAEIRTARLRYLAKQIAESLATQEGEDVSNWHFADALQQFAEHSRPSMLAKTRSAREWRGLLETLLATMGWPGKRRLDSIEYQQVSQWQQLMVDFESMDRVMAPMTYHQALAQLRGIVARHVFQPQTVDSPLQVLGLLEAAGLQFSHLWLMSMSEQQWPPAPNPNPLLPYALQREWAMPHASAERELGYARDLSQRFIDCTDHLLVSAATNIDDSPAQVSHLFAAFKRLSVEQLLGQPLAALLPRERIRQQHLDSGAWQPYGVGNAPALLAEERVAGGSSVFASQAACPFRAFARHRLHIKALGQASRGLTPGERGSLLHRALELLWRKLHDQQSLLALDDKQLNSLSADVCQYAVQELSQSRSVALGERFARLEQARLEQLVISWLELEKTRASFAVERIEDRQTFKFKQLSLETRIDRVDRLEDGSLLVIDYKTGNSSTSRWWGQRPEEPQLPLYGLLLDQAQPPSSVATDTTAGVGGIAYAQIRTGDVSVKGVGAQDSPESTIAWNPKIQSDSGALDWPQLKASWEQVLTALAEDFINGRADVDPKSAAQSCQYCDLASVCRINHQSPTDQTAAVQPTTAGGACDE